MAILLGVASLSVCGISLIAINRILGCLLVCGRRQLQDTGHVNQLADESVWVGEVVDVVVLELEEGGHFGLLVDDYRQH